VSLATPFKICDTMTDLPPATRMPGDSVHPQPPSKELVSPRAMILSVTHDELLYELEVISRVVAPFRISFQIRAFVHSIRKRTVKTRAPLNPRSRITTRGLSVNRVANCQRSAAGAGMQTPLN